MAHSVPTNLLTAHLQRQALADLGLDTSERPSAPPRLEPPRRRRPTVAPEHLPPPPALDEASEAQVSPLHGGPAPGAAYAEPQPMRLPPAARAPAARARVESAPPVLDEQDEGPIAAISSAPRPSGAGHLAVFFASHGGTGCTTIACNVATALARAGKRTCLVDLDMQLGDVLTVLNLEPRSPMSRLAREIGAFEWAMLEPSLPRHSTGLTVVSQVGCIEEINELTVGRIPELLRELQARYEFVIVDGVRDFSDHALASMDVADDILIVVTQDVPSVRGVTRRLSIFNRLGYPGDKIRIIANRFDRRSEITLQSIARAIGREAAFAVPNDFVTVHKAVTRGLPVAQCAPGSEVAHAIDAMTAALFGMAAPSSPVKKGFIARLLRKG